MPMYHFKCEKCEIAFETLCRIGKVDHVRCDKCEGKVEQLLTAPGAVIFANPKGTSREDDFEYVAKYNMERAQTESRLAKENNKQGHVYKEIDDMPRYEGKIV